MIRMEESTSTNEENQPFSKKLKKLVNSFMPINEEGIANKPKIMNK